MNNVSPTPQEFNVGIMLFPPDIDPGLREELLLGADVPRTGWLQRGIAAAEAETIGQHSSKSEWAAGEYAPTDSNLRYCVDVFKKMMRYHDIVEMPKDGRDYTPDEISKADKYKIEKNILQRILPGLGAEGPEIALLLEELHDRITYRARIGKEIDIMDAFVQALEYDRQGYTSVRDFYTYTAERLTTERFQNMYQILMKQRHSWSHAYFRYGMLLKLGGDEKAYNNAMKSIAR